MTETETERQVYKCEVTEDLKIEAHVGYGRSVSVVMMPDKMHIDRHLEPHEARALALALMDAAYAAENAQQGPAMRQDTLHADMRAAHDSDDMERMRRQLSRGWNEIDKLREIIGRLETRISALIRDGQ